MPSITLKHHEMKAMSKHATHNEFVKTVKLFLKEHIVSPSTRKVLEHFMKFKHNRVGHGLFLYKQETLADRVGVSVRSISNAYKQLEELGLIKRMKNVYCPKSRKKTSDLVVFNVFTESQLSEELSSDLACDQNTEKSCDSKDEPSKNEGETTSSIQDQSNSSNNNKSNTDHPLWNRHKLKVPSKIKNIIDKFAFTDQDKERLFVVMVRFYTRKKMDTEVIEHSLGQLVSRLKAWGQAPIENMFGVFHGILKNIQKRQDNPFRNLDNSRFDPYVEEGIEEENNRFGAIDHNEHDFGF